MKYLLVILALLIFPSTAMAAEQGIYYNGSDPAALDWVKASGLKFVISPPSPVLEQELSARDLGAYWSVPFNTHDTTVIQRYKTSPVTRGWYIADEPQIVDGGLLRWWAQTIRSLDPTHPTLSVHWGCDEPMVRLSMRPFADGADWMGTDCYPIGIFSSRLVGPAFKTGPHTARRLSKTFWAVTQASSWESMCGASCGRPETQWPSWREMQIMRDCALAAHAKIIAWFWLDGVLSGGSRRLQDLATAVSAPRRKCFA